jgi:hypothetical protein
MIETIQLDLAFENDIQELYDMFENTPIEFEVLIEEGPGGGWPVCQLTSKVEVLEKWLLENYCDEDDLNYYMGREE